MANGLIGQLHDGQRDATKGSQQSFSGWSFRLPLRVASIQATQRFSFMVQVLPWEKDMPVYLDGPQPPFPSGSNATLGLGDVRFAVEQDLALAVVP